MRIVVRWSAAVLVGLLGLLHVQFSVPNFLFSSECSGSPVTCTVLHEALLSLLAGVALLLSAALVAQGRALPASALAVAGTVPLTLFFWLVAIPTGLSDQVFGWMSLPAPTAATLALVATLLVRATRS